jgi:glycosyltransferase involved in cell wall biosynthesis
VFQLPGPLHLEYLFYRRAEIATAGPADYWIGGCQWVADRYRRSGIAPERIFVSNVGVDLDDYAYAQRGKLRGELGVGETVKLVGMVALMYAPKRLLAQRRGVKGHEDFIDALAICLRREPSIMGIFIGGAWNNAIAYERRVRAYARERCGDRAVFLGTRDDVAALVPDLDVAVQPSHSENMAETAIGAQLQGIPVIATQVGGFPDLIEPGATGWLVPPRSPARLAEAILEVVQDPQRARTMACAGRERAAELCNGAKQSRQVLDSYHTILSSYRLHSQRRYHGGTS